MLGTTIPDTLMPWSPPPRPKSPPSDEARPRVGSSAAAAAALGASFLGSWSPSAAGLSIISFICMQAAMSVSRISCTVSALASRQTSACPADPSCLTQNTNRVAPCTAQRAIDSSG